MGINSLAVSIVIVIILVLSKFFVDCNSCTHFGKWSVISYIYCGFVKNDNTYNIGGMLCSFSYLLDHFGILSFHDGNLKHHDAIFFAQHEIRTLIMNVLLYIDATILCCFLSISYSGENNLFFQIMILVLSIICNFVISIYKYLFSKSKEDFSKIEFFFKSVKYIDNIFEENQNSSDSMTWSGVLLNSYLICFFI